MKTSTRLALAATVFAGVFFFFGFNLLDDDSVFNGTLSIIVLAWAFKFILGSLIDKKAKLME